MSRDLTLPPPTAQVKLMNKRARILVREYLKDNSHEKCIEHTKELRELFLFDPSFEYYNVNSLRIMIRLNLLLRAIPFHNFGLKIELAQLIGKL